MRLQKKFQQNQYVSFLFFIDFKRLNNFFILVNNQNSLMRQISDGTISSNDSSITPLNSPLPFKKRAWTSSNLQNLTDSSTNPKVLMF